MRRYTKIEKIISLMFVPILTLLMFFSIVNSHTHLINGIHVTHSHFYKSKKEDHSKPLKSHKHTEQEILVYSSFGSISFEKTSQIEIPINIYKLISLSDDIIANKLSEELFIFNNKAPPAL